MWVPAGIILVVAGMMFAARAVLPQQARNVRAKAHFGRQS
jgi:hypothetical protein